VSFHQPSDSRRLAPLPRGDLGQGGDDENLGGGVVVLAVSHVHQLLSGALLGFSSVGAPVEPD
jgi:hypothetical protein